MRARMALAAALGLLLTAPPASASWDTDKQAPAPLIEGYTSEVSVLPGEAVHLHVHTSPAATYRILIYRMGWWDGASSPPLLACVPSCTTSRQGVDSPTAPLDPVTGKLDAGWPETD